MCWGKALYRVFLNSWRVRMLQFILRSFNVRPNNDIRSVPLMCDSFLFQNKSVKCEQSVGWRFPNKKGKKEINMNQGWKWHFSITFKIKFHFPSNQEIEDLIERIKWTFSRNASKMNTWWRSNKIDWKLCCFGVHFLFPIQEQFKKLMSGSFIRFFAVTF